MSKSPRKPARLSPVQMQTAITLIDRRLVDIANVNYATIRELDGPTTRVLSNKLHELIVEIFGADTIEYDRYGQPVQDLFDGGLYMGMSAQDIQIGYAAGIEKSRQVLEAIKAGFLEKLQDAGRGEPSRALKAYQGMDLHPAIQQAAGTLFADGHYASAILNAVIALNDLVRLKSGVTDRDGVTLMQHVFSSKSPLLKFNALASKTDEEEQFGFQQMFCGAVSGLRNPRAHSLIKDDPERALEFIAFVSLLAKLTEQATKA